MSKQLISADEAVTSNVQHTKPCSDCPFARKALNGWLGGASVEEWLERARTNTQVQCHVIENQQCAGLAIYRRNTCQLPRPPLLVLEADKTTVFANPMEFTAHHSQVWNPNKKRKRNGRRKGT